GGGAAKAGAGAAAAANNAKAPEPILAMHLGGAVGDGYWASAPEESLAAAAYRRLRLTRWHPTQVSTQCRTECHHFAPSARESEKDIAKAKMSCAPAVFVPGAQKGASTFLFHAITWHPQVLQPLRGAHDFKETGRYLSNIGRGDNRLGVRMAAFPFIEDFENFMTGDGTVTYMSADK
ncbi:unnamed protein product, partial [Phaeothamnion confervicola]